MGRRRDLAGFTAERTGMWAGLGTLFSFDVRKAPPGRGTIARMRASAINLKSVELGWRVPISHETVRTTNSVIRRIQAFRAVLMFLGIGIFIGCTQPSSSQLARQEHPPRKSYVVPVDKYSFPDVPTTYRSRESAQSREGFERIEIWDDNLAHLEANLEAHWKRPEPANPWVLSICSESFRLSESSEARILVYNALAPESRRPETDTICVVQSRTDGPWKSGVAYAFPSGYILDVYSLRPTPPALIVIAHEFVSDAGLSVFQISEAESFLTVRILTQVSIKSSTYAEAQYIAPDSVKIAFTGAYMADGELWSRGAIDLKLVRQEPASKGAGNMGEVPQLIRQQVNVGEVESLSPVSWFEGFDYAPYWISAEPEEPKTLVLDIQEQLNWVRLPELEAKLRAHPGDPDP